MLNIFFIVGFINLLIEIGEAPHKHTDSHDIWSFNFADYLKFRIYSKTVHKFDLSIINIINSSLSPLTVKLRKSNFTWFPFPSAKINKYEHYTVVSKTKRILTVDLTQEVAAEAVHVESHFWNLKILIPE